jgi:hypothetical protein
MTSCPLCKARIQADAIFCSRCGKPLAVHETEPILLTDEAAPELRQAISRRRRLHGLIVVLALSGVLVAAGVAIYLWRQPQRNLPRHVQQALTHLAGTREQANLLNNDDPGAMHQLGVRIDHVRAEWIVANLLGVEVPRVMFDVTNVTGQPIKQLKFVGRFLRTGTKEMFGGEVSDYLASTFDSLPFDPGQTRTVQLTGTMGYRGEGALLANLKLDVEIFAVSSIGGQAVPIRTFTFAYMDLPTGVAEEGRSEQGTPSFYEELHRKGTASQDEVP